MNVLIVEDESLVARCLCRLMPGHHVTVVQSIGEVDARARYDMVFCDVGHHDPGQIEALAGQTRGSFVLMSGATPSSPVVRRLLTEGTLQWLAKPFAIADVRALVQAASVPRAGLEPALPREGNFKFPVSTDSTIRA